MVEIFFGYLSWSLKDLWGIKVMYCTVLCTETTVSNPLVLFPKSSWDVHLFRGPWVVVHCVFLWLSFDLILLESLVTPRLFCPLLTNSPSGTTASSNSFKIHVRARNSERGKLYFVEFCSFFPGSLTVFHRSRQLKSSRTVQQY